MVDIQNISQGFVRFNLFYMIELEQLSNVSCNYSSYWTWVALTFFIICSQSLGFTEKFWIKVSLR